MKKRVLSAFLAIIMLMTSAVVLTGSVGAASPFEGEEWYDQIDTVEVNREDPRSTFIPYADEETARENEASALTRDYSRSNYYKLLSGDDWSFKFAVNPAGRLTDPADNLSETGWDTTGWDTIKVPSNWQTIKDENGDFKYEKPIYTNQTYPWANYENVVLGANVVAPTVKNGVGHYQKTFTLPDGWENRNTFISFQGVESAFYLWVDGQKVGYAEDSYTADDFNITPYLDPNREEHTISVQVYRWSTGSYLENQDFIRLSGIFRDVYLYSKDSLELRDFFATTDIHFVTENGKETTEATGATLNLEAEVRNLGEAAQAGMKVEAMLYNSDGVAALDAPLVVNFTESLGKNQAVVASGSVEVDNPKLWFADDPNLYMMVLTLKDANGVTREVTARRIGFREVESKVYNENSQYQMMINNKRIVLRGVNRHETDYLEGRALSDETIINDLKQMKQYNINAIRTSHYPENTLTYDLADEFGIYMCDEVNVESHSGAFTSGSNRGIPSGYPIWNTAVLDRTKNMVERDKNHPSVVIWSLGNEATYSTYTMNDDYCFYLTTQWILERDPSRIRKYERDNRGTPGNREGSMVDIYSVQYPTVSWTESTTKTIKWPFIWSEYAHAMGNGLGNFDEYWDIVRNNPSAQGGFIWDYKDQSVNTKVINTISYKAIDEKTKTAATVVGSLENGLSGKALRGTLDIPVKSELNANSSALTLEAWVNPTAASGSHNTILSKGDSGYTLKINVQDSALEFFVDGYPKGTAMAELPDDLTDGTWKHIVGTCENGKLKVYYNGKILTLKNGSTEQSTSASAPLDSQNIQVGVGYTPGLSGRNFNGLIDSVGIYKCALSAAEIAAAYEAKTLSQAVTTEDVVYKMTFSDSEIVQESTGYPEVEYFGYGGDWGETRTDNDFCANGITYADGTPKPALTQVKKTHQEVSFYDVDVENGKVRIVNEFLNTDLNNYNINWTLKEDDAVLQSGTLENFSLAPLAETEVTLNFNDFTVKEGSDYILVFSVTQKTAPIWTAEENFEVAFEQFELNYAPEVSRPVIDVTNSEKLDVNDTEDAIEISGENFTASFNKGTGFLSNYTVNGTQIITDGPKPNYYKAPISNDTTSITNSKWAEYKNAADYMTVDPEDIIIDVKDKVVNIVVTGTLTSMNHATQTISYMVYANGDIVIDNTLTPNGTVGTLPRAGMRLKVADGFENLEYYGRGPVETYGDRKTGAKIGVYSSTVAEQAETKYVKPQNNGNRTDVRWMSLVNENGDGIMISTNDVMEASATNYIEEDMSNKRHWWMVPVQDEAIVTIDAKVRGLGNNSCAGDDTLPPYQVSGNTVINQCFRISPISAATDKMAESKKSNSSGYPIKNILIDGVAIENFNPNVLEYIDTKMIGVVDKVPQISVELLDPNATVEITQAATYPGSAIITATSAAGMTRVYTIRFERTNVLYASDMEWSLDRGGYFPNARDMCSCGESLGVYVDGEKTYFNKGLGMHAPATIEIDLEGKGVTRFQALVGVSADQTSTTANHIYVVYVDGKEAFRSPAMRARQNAVPVDVDVTGAKKITLYVDPNGIDGNDHAIWADAKFTIDAPTFEATLDASVYEGDLFDVTLKTSGEIGKLSLKNETGREVSKMITEKSQNEDGFYITKFQTAIGTPGEGRTITVYSNGVEIGQFTLDVLAKQIYSIIAPESAQRGERFNVEVTTASSLIKGKFVSEYGSSIGRTIVSRVKQGRKLVTNYELMIGTAGERTITFMADYDKQNNWPFSESFDITITQ